MFNVPLLLLLRQVTELESVLEEEKRQRSQALAARRRLEGELKEQEDLTEATSRGREEALKQLRKAQVSLVIPHRHTVYRKTTHINTIYIYILYILNAYYTYLNRRLYLLLYCILYICYIYIYYISVLLQAQQKELQREVEESRLAQREVLSSAREAERRLRATEAQTLQLQEVRPP